MQQPHATVRSKAPVFVSATRMRDGGFTRPCRYHHSDSIETDKCAQKRNANVVVRDQHGHISMAPAPYLRIRRQTQRIVRAAEFIALNQHAQMQRVLVAAEDIAVNAKRK